jgi:hypothetical protein
MKKKKFSNYIIVQHTDGSFTVQEKVVTTWKSGIWRWEKEHSEQEWKICDRLGRGEYFPQKNYNSLKEARSAVRRFVRGTIVHKSKA